MTWRHLTPAAVAVVLVGAACAQAGDPETRTSPSMQDPDPLVYRGQLVDVLPRDAIPSINDPRFVPPHEAERWLAGREPVVALEHGGVARAYPAQILTRHEIVNDVVAGRPVAITYCPLCNSAVAFDRDVDGRALEFGVSGKLYRSALIMYDRQTESLWTHFEGLAVQGPLTGTHLEVIPVQLLSFTQWRADHPDGEVLSRRTGFTVEYGTNPYEYYDRLDGPYEQFFRQAVNHRLPALARMVGVVIGSSQIAYPYRELSHPSGAGVVRDNLAGRRIVVFWRSGVASALDTEQIARGRDVGASGVFLAEASGRTLTFEARNGEIVDRETGSRWSVGGRATSGPLQGERLTPLPHLDAFWFAWQAYRPDTTVYGVDA
jgi:hypothetical protein